MVLGSKDDWKQYLSLDDEERINDFIRLISKYRGAYRNASDVKTAQMWCAILELSKEKELLKKRVSEMQEVFEAIGAKIKKKEEKDSQLLKSLENF